MRLYEIYTDASNSTYGVFHLRKEFVEESIGHKLTEEEFETLLHEYDLNVDDDSFVESLRTFHDILVDTDEITPKPIEY
mgnify:FL=1|jgi:hypothetical protein